MMSESHRIRPRYGVDMRYDCRLSIAVVGCILIIIISLVTWPFWICTTGMHWEKPGGLRKGWGEGDLCLRVGKMSGSGALPGWVPPVGSWNSPPVGSIARDVPSCHRARAEGGRMHVLLRPPGQRIWTWSWGRPIHHGAGRLQNIPEGDEGHLPQCVPFKKVPRVPLLWRMTKKKDHSGYTLLPDRSTAKLGISCRNWRSGPSGRGVG